MKQKIRIGTRGSQLALYQAELTQSLIRGQFPMTQTEIVIIKTSGDMIRKGGWNPFETKRVFTREIEDALLKKEIDLAVHSAKDMSVDLPEGLILSAALEREDPRDCLVGSGGRKLSELPLGARIGTSSVRRKVQLLRWNGELLIEDVRGNVDTRLRKLEEGLYDAIILAYAGIKRLGLANHVTEIFPGETFYPSPGQGAIAIESRAEDVEALEIIRAINHADTLTRLLSERAFLRRLEGGCQLPCGIMTELHRDQIKLSGGIFAIETRDWAEASLTTSSTHPDQAGKNLAEMILNQGGQKILDKIRETHGKK